MKKYLYKHEISKLTFFFENHNWFATEDLENIFLTCSELCLKIKESDTSQIKILTKKIENFRQVIPKDQFLQLLKNLEEKLRSQLNKLEKLESELTNFDRENENLENQIKSISDSQEYYLKNFNNLMNELDQKIKQENERFESWKNDLKDSEQQEKVEYYFPFLTNNWNYKMIKVGFRI